MGPRSVRLGGRPQHPRRPLPCPTASEPLALGSNRGGRRRRPGTGTGLPGAMGSQRESGRLCRAAACIAALAAALLLCAAPAGARDRLAPRDLEAAFDQLDALGGFFGAFAARETNAFAQERWWRLSRGYPGDRKSTRLNSSH